MRISLGTSAPVHLVAVGTASQPQPPGTRALGGRARDGRRRARPPQDVAAMLVPGLSAGASLHPAVAIPPAALQIVLVSQTAVIAGSFALLFSGLDPSKPGGIQDEVRWASSTGFGSGRAACATALLGRPCKRPPWHAPGMQHASWPTLWPHRLPPCPLVQLAVPQRRDRGHELQ